MISIQTIVIILVCASLCMVVATHAIFYLHKLASHVHDVYF